jgi:hypothetical protein
MTNILLQRLLDQIAPSQLPTNWRGFDFESFSRDKTLWDYQRQALEYALKALWKYYGQSEKTVEERKRQFYRWYKDSGLENNLDLSLDKSSAAKRKLAALQETYFEVDDGDTLPYWQFINSICFWMATGSGKTLVIVKLIELLHELIKRGEIPNHDILILTHRDDLLTQVQEHIADYNTSGDLYLDLHELRDYSEVKRAQPNLFVENERTIFYYRSDNLSDEQKEKIIDFRNYDNDGNWYILLDEAHKGDREDSKRQQIFAILARKGFLFNFSATFTDPREIITTAYNFNLSEFIRKGYGKHIYVFEQETRAFHRKEDFTVSEKQKIVLKTLILLTHLRQIGKKVQSIEAALYHRPLLLALVNSVNTKDADLKLLFRELVRIARGEIDEPQWKEAKAELLAEIAANPHYVYEPGMTVRLDQTALDAISKADLLAAVFNAESSGQIEVLFRPSDRKEVALKLKTSDEPFALIRIGDTLNWTNDELKDYEINHRFNDEGFFDRLNEPASSVNLLLGSRSFYEGWDSNRPNVIMYINIGTGTDAKKFILQSVGRGARIEPLPGYRKRIRDLYAGGQLSDNEKAIFQQVKGNVLPLESEYIFGTNRTALETVISELDQQDPESDIHEVSLRLNRKAVGDKILLIPVFKQQEQLLCNQRDLAKFSLSPDNLVQLKDYLAYLDDDRLLLALYNMTPKQIETVRASVAEESSHFKADGPQYKNLSVLVRQVVRYMSLHAQELEQFKVLEDEINHYKHIRVNLPEVKFEEFTRQLDQFYTQPNKIAELRAKYDAGQLSFDDLMRKAGNIEERKTFTYQHQSVEFTQIQQHYYLPLLVAASDDLKLDYLRSVIKVRSEVKFLEKLESVLDSEENPFNVFDWWLFSRIDETYDHINIPYYYPIENRIASFRPDFIFWLQKGNNYHMIFVDPKGTGRAEYEHKVDGFRELFERDEKPIVFKQGNLNIQVHLFLFTEDRNWVAEYYRRYWLDDPKKIIRNLA